MSVSRAKTSSILQRGPKYDFMLAGNPAWVEPGSFDSIATYTISGTSTSSVTFSSIPQTYKSLQIRATIVGSTAGADIECQWNGGGTTYSYHNILGSGGGTSPSGTANSGQTWSRIADSIVKGSSTDTSAFIADFVNYSYPTWVKSFRSVAGSDANGSGRSEMLSGSLAGSSAAISSISLRITSPYFLGTGSVIALYGIK